MSKFRRYRKSAGLLALSFGAGVFMAFMLPGRALAFVEAAVILCAGFLLLK